MSRAEEIAAKLAQQARDERAEAPAKASAPAKPRPRAEAPAPAPAPAPAAGWAGAVPRASIPRRPLNVGMPTTLDIHRRLAQLAAAEGIAAQDAVAEAVDQWLTERGYPRPEV